MKAEDIRDLTDDEIRDRLKDLKMERFRLRFRGATQELENPKLVQTVRKDIARMNTILRERELAQQGS